MNERYDVVVVGGGTAGTVAAIQAGRAGGSALLIEKTAMLGGTLTVAGVNAPAHFFAWGRQVIAGIGWELVRRTLEEASRDPLDFSQAAIATWQRHIPVSIPIFAALCDEAALGAGVDLQFHSMLAAVVREADGWQLTVCTKSGLQRVRARALIDATGDANAVTLAGLPVERPATLQPATLTMHCSGYDFDRLDLPAIDEAADRAIRAGTLRHTDLGWWRKGAGQFLRSRGHNTNHFRAPGADTSEGRSRAEIEGRRSLLRAYRFLRAQPGLENLVIESVSAEAGIRETVVIRGQTRMTVQDYEAGRLYPDAVCYAFYHIDEHLHGGDGINGRKLRDGVLPTIPRGAMLPEGSRGLIVAGRCIAGDRETNSATRVEAPCMAMGQAAGAMAVLSVRTGRDAADLPMADIRALLREHGAIVPECAASR